MPTEISDDLVVEAVVALELGDDRLLQLGDAVHIGVFGLAAADCGNRRFLYVVRRVEIGLAGSQADHVAAFRLEGAGLGGDGDGLCRLDAVERTGKKTHVVVPRDDCVPQERARLDSAGVSPWQEKSASTAVCGRWPVSIAVVGGGVAGIATAIALARQGIAVEVFEQAGADEAVGAGIQIGPNAARALQAIGAYEAVVARSTIPGGLVIRNGATGATLAAMAFGRSFEDRFGMPYRVAHRADLLAALLATANRLAGITLHYGSRVTAVAADGGGRHRLQLADGSEHRFPALIGADGIRSTVRAHLLRDGPPVASGHRLYRALLDAASLPPAIAENAVALYLLDGCPCRHLPAGRRPDRQCGRGDGRQRRWRGVERAGRARRGAARPRAAGAHA